MIVRRLCIVCSLLICISFAFAEDDCKLDFKDLGNNMVEYSSDVVSVKIEEGNSLVKMKMTEAFETFDWVWVSYEKGPAKIDGVSKKDGELQLVAQLIANRTKSGRTNWALYTQKQKGAEAIAYFTIDNQQTCRRTTFLQWQRAVWKVFGNKFADQGTIISKNAKDVYEHLGIARGGK